VTGPLTRSTIVVVTWRGKGHVSACLDAVATQTRPHRLLVVDNASDDGTAEVLATHPSAPDVLRLPVNVGYAGALAAVSVDTEFVAWLNDDTEPAQDWLSRLEDALDQHKAAAASSSMMAQDGTVISVGVGLTADGHGMDLTDQDAAIFGFCGGAALLRTETLRQVGGVPARFFCYYEDTDTAWRLRLAGHTIVSVPSARVTHRHGASTQLGSRQFHLWNERNRLAMLIRCAPAAVAVRELARFAAITALLPLRRLAPVDNSRPARQKCRWPRVALKPGGPLPHRWDIRAGSRGEALDNIPWNFRVQLRLQVLRELAVTIGPLLHERRTVTRVANVPRSAVWRGRRSANSPS
jgi:GT2 family glycosyltransferase